MRELNIYSQLAASASFMLNNNLTASTKIANAYNNNLWQNKRRQNNRKYMKLTSMIDAFF